jgi:hypothetical protein
MTHQVRGKVYSKLLKGPALLERLFMDPQTQETFAVIVNLTRKKDTDLVYIYDVIVPIEDLDDWEKYKNN